eukprot:m.175401 g.175401  ORF g.175401 m.175401 type:complete len:330 (+) comp13986_c0_seq1:84-1073(+)
MPRNRLSELNKFPQVTTLEASANPDDPLVENGEQKIHDPWTEIRDEEMNKFFNVVKQIRHDFLQQIEASTPEVEAGYNDLIRAVSKHDTAKATNRIEKHSETVKTLSTRTKVILNDMPGQTEEFRQRLEAHLLDMGATAEEALEESTGNSDVRIRVAQHKSLMSRFIAVMTKYNDMQQQSKDRHVDDLVRQIKVSDPDKYDSTAGEAEARRIAESGETLQLLSTSSRLAAAEEALGRIRGRHEDIQRLAKSLAELHQMFLDMALMVEQQGEMIDRIEMNVSQSANYVVRAKGQLVQARVFQSQAREKKMWCMGICAAAVALIVIIIIYA